MAVANESQYFPPLDKYLVGDARLISWRVARRALCDEKTAVENSTLEQFLNDPETIDILSKPLNPFGAPSQKSASDFETKTAPINVSQASNGEYKLDELKSDAKWLSKELQVEELVALRMAILEWQERPADQVLTILTGTNNSLANPLELSTNGLTKNSANFASNGGSHATIDFANECLRRRRLLGVYFTESAHLLKLSADLVGRGVIKDPAADVRSNISRKAGSKHSWVDDLAAKVTLAVCQSERRKEAHDFFSQCMGLLEDTFRNAHDKSVWPSPVKDDEAGEQIYCTFQYDMLVHNLRLYLSGLYSLKEVPGPSPVSKWFSLMHEHHFLQHGLPMFDGMDFSIAQHLISIISVETLKVQLATSQMGSKPGSRDKTSNDAAYVDNEDCLVMVNQVLHECAAEGFTIAAPAITAWSTITALIQDIANGYRSMRERRIEYPGDGTDGVNRSSRRDSRDAVSLYERVLEKLSIDEFEEGRDDPTRYFLGIAVDQMRVFALLSLLSPAVSAAFGSPSDSATAYICRQTSMSLIRDCLQSVNYGSELLEAILTLLTPYNPSPDSIRHTHALAENLLHDEHGFRPAVLHQALARYPYELSPMLRLFTAVASAQIADRRPIGPTASFQILDNLDSITQMVPESFRSYQLEHEDDNANIIMLTDALPIFVTRQELLSWNPERFPQRALRSDEEPESRDILSVPAGTPGVLVRESRPFVLKLDYRHSSLEFLGLLLSTFLASSELVPGAPHADVDRLKAAEIITLFTALLNASLNQHQGTDQAKSVLVRLSSALSDEQDVVFVVTEILGAELLAYLDQDAKEGSLELAIACVEFLLPLSKVTPERVWSTLARSSLLGMVDGAVSLASVVGGVEVQIGHFRFLKACVSLHALLLEDAISGIVKRKARPPRHGSRFDSPIDSQDSTPERAMSMVLSAYQKVLLDVLQNLPQWRFVSFEEKCQVTTGITDSFTRLLESTYGVDVEKAPSERLTTVLGPAASAMLAMCTSQAEKSPLMDALGRILQEGLAGAEDRIPVQSRLLVSRQTNSTLRFFTILIRSAKSDIDLLKGSQGRSGEESYDLAAKHAVAYASSVLDHMPIFACLLGCNHAFKAEVFTLLSELVQTIGSTQAEPPSILGHISADAAKAFLELATQLDRPLSDVRTEEKAWAFLSSIMTYRQQWCAMYLLTGALPKDKAQSRHLSPKQSKPLFRFVLDQLCGISTLSPERAVGMLRFLAAAQQTWAWATNELRSHQSFLKSVLEWLDNLKAPPREPSSASALISAKEYEMAAFICDIVAVNLHASMEMNDKTVIKALMSKFKFLRQHSTSVNAYNKSLHKNLADNLKRKFPQSELSDFKRTDVNPAPLGTEFFYNRDLATSILRHDIAWEGANPGRNQGFLDEFARANANLSIVHAQYLLLKSFKTLATTLCECADQDAAVPAELAKVAQQCLLSNANTRLDEPAAAKVLELRLDIAFVVLSKLNAIRTDTGLMKELLLAAWELVRTSPVDYDVATEPNDFEYYRKLLQILYLTIQPLGNGTPKIKPSSGAEADYLDPSIASCLVSVVGRVIAPGFRALCGNLHNDLRLALPADFGLMTALMQGVLSVPGINSVYAMLSDVVANSSITRGAFSLYSWSDQLAELTDQDPVYGEIAIMFLLALSTIPPVAEQMAIEGALSQLSAANLTDYFRKPGGKGPYDEPQRMFVIWTEGILPICLNLLDAVGPAIAAEVATFLNSFPKQLQRAQKSLQNETPSPRNPTAGSVTLGLVSEAHSLSMIAMILRSDVARAAAEGIIASDVPPFEYDLESVRATVEGLSRTKRSLNDRIRASSSREKRWEMTPVTGVSDNLLQAKVMRELQNMLLCLGGNC